MTDENYDKICEILDKLLLDTLTLMEQTIDGKIQLEQNMSEGEDNIAKSRYIIGQSKVGKLQLPSEESAEFDAVASVTTGDEKPIRSNHFDLDVVKADCENNPIRWFGYLVPDCLKKAQEYFRRSVYCVAKVCNTQLQLNDTIVMYKKLMTLKHKLNENKQ